MRIRALGVYRLARSAALVTVATLGLCGCGTPIEDICQDIGDCEGRSDAELAPCVAEGEDLEAEAEGHGCAAYPQG